MNAGRLAGSFVAVCIALAAPSHGAALRDPWRPIRIEPVAPLERPLASDGGIVVRAIMGDPPSIGRLAIPATLALVRGRERIELSRSMLGDHLYQFGEALPLGAWTLEGLGEPRDISVEEIPRLLHAPEDVSIVLDRGPPTEGLIRRWEERIAWRETPPTALLVQLAWRVRQSWWQSNVLSGAREVRNAGALDLEHTAEPFSPVWTTAGAPSIDLRARDTVEARFIDVYGRDGPWSRLVRPELAR
jgi:hypothetical protein